MNFDDCEWNSFFANIIRKLYILLSIKSDVRCLDEKINVSTIDLNDKIDELVFELKSLFWWLEKDFHGNKYEDINDQNEN